jgi:hypothetical protein
MFARLLSRRKAITQFLAVLSLTAVAACSIPAIGGGGGGQAIDPSQPVPVALLLPSGSGQSTDDLLAQNLENAARLAISDLQGAQIDLRVYQVGADPQRTANITSQAIADGAKIILGPLYAETANAAGLAAAGAGINVLAFSNNPTIAGGNVFLLGTTFDNTANRLVRYGLRNSINSYVIAHASDLQGEIGRDAIARALRTNGATLAGVQGYALSQEGVLGAANPIASAVNATGADAVFMTGGVNADLPILVTALRDAGLNPAQTRYLGLTRWDAAPEALALPALQGGIFAIPDQSFVSNFEARYSAAYGSAPHPLAGLAYDGIAAIGALVARGDANALTRGSLTQGQGFQGTQGVFRFLADGTVERGLAVATIQNNQVVVLDPAPRSFAGAGF